MGAAAADYDNDGHVDLFVAGVARNQLLRNRGDGSFEDVTEQSRIASGEWAAAAGWFDYDNDGRLDLLVVNYVRWSAQGGPLLRRPGARRAHLLPSPVFRRPAQSSLPQSRRRHVRGRVGSDRHREHVGKGMSAAFADYDHDGDMDAFVTNDTVPNFLFRNNGDGTFTESRSLAGVALPESGRPISGMGVDFQDYDNDGWEDIHLTGISGETFPLFRNDSRTRTGTFSETTASSGLGRLTARLSGWCSVFADVDNDGAKDLFTANSHPNDRIDRTEASGWQQPNSLFVNDGAGRFRDAGDTGLAARPAVHRGCAIADFDADGRADIVVLVLGGSAELWHNETGNGHAWLDRAPDRHAQQSRRHRRAHHRRRAGPHDDHCGRLRLVFARRRAFRTGETAGPVTVRVEWPSGTKQVVDGISPNRVVEIREPE